MSNKQLKFIKLSAIKVSDTNTRSGPTAYAGPEFDSLVASVKANGVLQTVLVRQLAKPFIGGIEYELVAGERRYRAATIAELETIPATVQELDDKQAILLQTVENLERKSLNAIEEAQAMKNLQVAHDITAEETAKILGVSRATVYGRLKLLELHEHAQNAVREGKLIPSVAEILARIKDAPAQQEILKEILEAEGGPMSFREAKEFIYYEINGPVTRSIPINPQPPFVFDQSLRTYGSVPCAECPNNTINDPKASELFGDNECLDNKCFTAKQAASIEQAVERAIDIGFDVTRNVKAVLCPKGFVDLDTHFFSSKDREIYRYGDILNEEWLRTTPLVEKRVSTQEARGTVHYFVNTQKAHEALLKLGHMRPNTPPITFVQASGTPAPLDDDEEEAEYKDLSDARNKQVFAIQKALIELPAMSEKAALLAALLVVSREIRQGFDFNIDWHLTTSYELASHFTTQDIHDELDTLLEQGLTARKLFAMVLERHLQSRVVSAETDELRKGAPSVDVLSELLGVELPKTDTKRAELEPVPN